MVALWSEWPVKQDEQVSVHVDHICDVTRENQAFVTKLLSYDIIEKEVTDILFLFV